MILKKPYGFLIKHFKLIHIILTLATIFIAVRSGTVLTFFRDFIRNGYTVTVYETIARDTVRPFLFLILILIIIALIAMYILLKVKNKPNKFYFFAILYYVLLLILLFISYFLINGLNETLWETASARTFRDIAQIVYYPQFIFVIILGIRALGFNVKQFDFKQDMLEISDSDSEEVELNINFETYKAKRTIHRTIRELKYYFLENKLIICIIGGVLGVVLVFSLIKGYEKLKYNYNENETFSYNGLSINIEESILTDIDMAGKEIYKDKYYLVIKLNITNNTHERKKLDYTSFKIYIGSNIIYPTLDIGNYFIDYGYPYMNYEIDAGANKTYVMAYILNKDQIKNKYNITLYNGEAQKTDKFLAKTITIKIKPTKLIGVEDVRTASINENISLSSSLLGNTTINIKNVEFTKRYTYKYESCINEECKEYDGLVLIQGTSSSQETLMILDYDFTIDNTTEAYKSIQNIKTFINTFGSIEYLINGKTYTKSITNVTPSEITEKKLVLKIPEEASNADYLNLRITIRNRCYVIKLIEKN